MDIENNRPIETTTEEVGKIEKTEQPEEIIEEIIYEIVTEPGETIEEIIEIETEDPNEITNELIKVDSEHSDGVKIEEIEEAASNDDKDEINDISNGKEENSNNDLSEEYVSEVENNDKETEDDVIEQEREIQIEEEKEELQPKEDESSKIIPTRPNRKRPVDEHLNIESLRSMTQSMNEELKKLRAMIEEKDRSIKDIRSSFTKMVEEKDSSIKELEEELEMTISQTQKQLSAKDLQLTNYQKSFEELQKELETLKNNQSEELVTRDIKATEKEEAFNKKYNSLMEEFVKSKEDYASLLKEKDATIEDIKGQLESAKVKMRDISFEVNEEKRKVESQTESQISIQKLMQRFTNYSVFSKKYGELVITPTCRIIEAECVPVVTSRSPTLRSFGSSSLSVKGFGSSSLSVKGKPEFILLNDVLLYVKKAGKDSLEIKEWFNLDSIVIKRIESEENGNYFSISRGVDGKEFAFDADFGEWYQTLSLIKTGCFIERENDIDRNSMGIGFCYITKDSADTTRLKIIAKTRDGFIDEPIIISGRFKHFSIKSLCDSEGNPVTFDSLNSLIDGVKSAISQE